MYHIKHNEEERLSINLRLTHELNKDIQILNHYKKLMRSTNQIIDTALDKLSHHDLLSYLEYIDSKLNEIETFTEYCKMRIMHSSILTTNELSLITLPINKKLISKKLKINWLLSNTLCTI